MEEVHSACSQHARDVLNKIDPFDRFVKKDVDELLRTNAGA